MSQQQSVFSETEKKAAERYLWWPVYLVREKRRLAGITEAVRAGAADTGHHAPLPTPEVESAEEFLLRAEQLGEEAFPDPMTTFESQSEDQDIANNIIEDVADDTIKVKPISPTQEEPVAHQPDQIKMATQSSRGIALQAEDAKPAIDDLLAPQEAVKEAFQNQPEDEQVVIEDL